MNLRRSWAWMPSISDFGMAIAPTLRPLSASSLRAAAITRPLRVAERQVVGRNGVDEDVSVTERSQVSESQPPSTLAAEHGIGVVAMPAGRSLLCVMMARRR